MTDAATRARHEPGHNISFYRLDKGEEVPFAVVHLSRSSPCAAGLCPPPEDGLYLWTQGHVTGDPVRAAEHHFRLVAQERDRYRRPGWLPTAFDAEFSTGHLRLHDGTVEVIPYGNPWRGLAAAGLLRRARPGLLTRVRGLLDGNLYMLGPRLDTIRPHDLEWLLQQRTAYRVMLAPSDQDALATAAADNRMPPGLFTALSHVSGASLITVHNPRTTHVALLRNGRAPTETEQAHYGITEQQPVLALGDEQLSAALAAPGSPVYISGRLEPAVGFVPAHLFGGTFPELCDLVAKTRHTEKTGEEKRWLPLDVPRSAPRLTIQ